MNYKDKLFTKASLISRVGQWRANGEIIVLCHGVFNVVHPGHLRFLEFAKSQGDRLLVAVTGDEGLPQPVRTHFFDERERVNGLCAVSFVDAVIAVVDEGLPGLIKQLQPELFVKGREHKLENVRPELEQAVRAHGGNVIYSSGDVKYTATDFLHAPAEQILQKEYNQFRQACLRHKITYKQLTSIAANFAAKKILVVGDTIIDQYVVCDALGMSAEAPIIALKEIEGKAYLGGAGIIACHLQSVGAEAHFFSVLGQDGPREVADQTLTQSGVRHHLISDPSRPTTFKRRFIVDQRPMYKVSRLKEHELHSEIENEMLACIAEVLPQMDGIILADYAYGVITPTVIERILAQAKSHSLPVFCDAQSSSQIGDITRFKAVELITPTEREARMSLSDNKAGLERLGHELMLRTGNRNVVITLGANGLIAFGKKVIDNTLLSNSQHFPALVTNPLDVTGAGDALLSVMTLSLVSGASIMEAAVLGSCMAAIQVNRVGNIPITSDEFATYLADTIKPVFDS